MNNKDREMLQSALQHISNSVTNGRSQTAENEITRWLKSKINATVDVQQSENLNEEIKKYFASVDLKEVSFADIARHFAQWQKEQMMKSTIDGTVGEGNPQYPQWGEHLPTIAYSDMMLLPKDFKFGDKIKIIVIKEDLQNER